MYEETRIKETREVEVTKERKWTCELCGKTTDKEGWDITHWGDVNSTIVRMDQGQSWPEGTFVTKTFLDICTECFENKLIPWVESQGGKPRVVETDY